MKNLKEILSLMRKNKVKLTIKEDWSGGERGFPETFIFLENKEGCVKVPRNLIN